MIYYKIIGKYYNGHHYKARVSKIDYPSFMENYLDSTSDGSFLDPDSITTTIEEVED